MKFVKFFLWLVVFVVLYFSFLVLLQHGPVNFKQGLKQQVSDTKELLGLKEPANSNASANVNTNTNSKKPE